MQSKLFGRSEHGDRATGARREMTSVSGHEDFFGNGGGDFQEWSVIFIWQRCDQRARGYQFLVLQHEQEEAIVAVGSRNLGRRSTFAYSRAMRPSYASRNRCAYTSIISRPGGPWGERWPATTTFVSSTQVLMYGLAPV